MVGVTIWLLGVGGACVLGMFAYYYYSINNESDDTVLILGTNAEGRRDELRECPVTRGDGGRQIALWDMESDEEPLPIVLDESKIRVLDGQPYYRVDLSKGHVYTPRLDRTVNDDPQVERISAQTLRAEQLSTTIQDIAAASNNNLRELLKMAPLAFGTLIMLLVFLIVVVLAG